MALVLVKIGIGFFAQHAQEATATGAMLLAIISFSIFSLSPSRPRPTSRLFARHGLEADATGTMPEAMHSVSLSDFKVGSIAMKTKRFFPRHVLEADATGTLAEALSNFPS